MYHSEKEMSSIFEQESELPFSLIPTEQRPGPGFDRYYQAGPLATYGRSNSLKQHRQCVLDLAPMSAHRLQ